MLHPSVNCSLSQHYLEIRNRKCDIIYTAVPRLQMFRKDRFYCGLNRGTAAARLLELRVRIPLRTWMFVSCVCCVLCE
jgi:hypothetical protein